MESRRRGCSLERHRMLQARGRRIHEGHRHNSRLREEACQKVPVSPFRDRFVELQRRGEMNLAELCIFMGWVYRPTPERLRAERRRPGYMKPNTPLARRTLGMSGCKYAKEHVTYETAERLMRVLGMDPHEAGI